MLNLPKLQLCNTKVELISEMQRIHKELINYYLQIPEEYYFAKSIPDGWTVIRNIKHLASTTYLFNLLLKIPKPIKKLFGKPRSKPIDLDRLVVSNRPLMHDYGKYIKINREVKNLDKTKYTDLIQNSVNKLVSTIETYTDEELDNIKGALGSMSTKDILHFLMKHNIHHTNVTRQRILSGEGNISL
jgi:uncharacterized damage-inducible protein DinB